MALVYFGVAGAPVLLTAAGLAGVPLVLSPLWWHAIAGAGICAIVLSKLVGDWILLGMLGNIASVAGAAMAAAAQNCPGNANLGGAGFGAGSGLYCLVLGFGMLFYSYARRAN